MGETGSYGPESLRVAEEILGALHAWGLAQDEAVTAFHALISYTLGAAALGSAATRELPEDTASAEWLALRKAQFDTLSMDRYPHVVGSAHLLARFATASAFQQGLRNLLGSLRVD